MMQFKQLLKIDFRVILIIFCLMIISLLVISSMTQEAKSGFFTFYVRKQLKIFCLSWVLFFCMSMFDYRKLRGWTWIFYVLTILLLLGLYFAHPIQNVRRWYRIPFIGISLQPSEIAKLVLVVTLAWYLEKNSNRIYSLRTAFCALLLVALPFLLILKQPDLGTAFVLFPISLIMGYFGNLHQKFLKIFTYLGVLTFLILALFQTEIIPHKKMRPFFTKFLKEYQYERLNPHSYHQKAAEIAIAIGGVMGSGWNKSEFSSQKWLPAAHTDSVFSAYGEEFGLLGMSFLLVIYYCLIYLSFRVSLLAKDPFGRLLACGLAVYFAMHILINIGMMCGFLPISGVPLILITYGGSSIFTTMIALGILQSIYIRRFMFG